MEPDDQRDGVDAPGVIDLAGPVRRTQAKPLRLPVHVSVACGRVGKGWLCTRDHANTLLI